MRYTYPNGLRKALTFSYDDGQIHDRRLVEIFNKYGMKATFHLNSGILAEDGQDHVFLKKSEVAELFKGHEVAVHGVQHRNLPTITKQQQVIEIEEDRKALEKLTGYMVKGMSYAYGNYSGEVMDLIETLGIKYSRTVGDSYGYFPPADFRAWNPTCHHDKDIFGMGKTFLDIWPFMELPMMYVWGHSFEFAMNNNWERIEEFCEMMSGKDDIWYATNIEICEYINAVRRMEYSADGLTVKNPNACSVWMKTDAGELLEIKGGETRYLGEHQEGFLT